MRRTAQVLLVISTLFMANALFGLSYFYMEVDGETSTECVQGQEQYLLADCAPLGSIDVFYYLDLDSSGTIEDGEPVVFAMSFLDNNDEFPPDLDPTEGTMRIIWPLHMPPGHYVILGMEGSDAEAFPYRVFEPDPLLHSVSGSLVFEGITPPNPDLANIPFIIGTMDPPVLMYAITDEWGNFRVNWPGDPAMVVALFLMEIPGYITPDMPMMFVDGHVTGWEIEFLLGGTLTNLKMSVDGVEVSEVYQGMNYVFSMDCPEWSLANIEILADEDGDGMISPGDWNFFDQTWIVDDNRWTDEWYRDENDTPGEIAIRPPFHLPPGSYIFRAFEGSADLELSFRVLPPDPLTHSVSGRVELELITPPDGMLGRLVVSLSDFSGWEQFYGRVDEMGNFTINWAFGDRDVLLGVTPPYPSEDWDFAGATHSVFVDGIMTGMDIFVPYAAFEDSIHIVFETDEGLWDIGQGEIKAVYINPTTFAVISEKAFPNEGDIYIPVRSEPCGIVFDGVSYHFAEHNFLSPYDTLWITADVFPAEYHLFASQCCHHFKLGLDGFEPDSLPIDGIQYDLYGEGPEGQRYHSKAKMFIQLIDDEYVVVGGREMCPANWTAVLPDPLPAGYLPEVFETTFVIPRVDTWPHMLIMIPVSFDNISEAELPEELSLNVYPNPFNASVTIDFRSAEPGEVSIEVFDMMGRRVTNLSGKVADKGAFRARWDCKDSFGKNVSTGVYLFKITTPTETRIVKGMYLK